MLSTGEARPHRAQPQPQDGFKIVPIASAGCKRRFKKLGLLSTAKELSLFFVSSVLGSSPREKQKQKQAALLLLCDF